MSDDVAVIHIDGASRGNPGDAAYAVVIQVPGHAAIEEAGVLGKETNNVAEYTALIKAMEKAKHLGLKRLHVHSDSELIVKQVRGEYKVKNDDLKWLCDEARKLMKDFASVTLTHVRREQNKRADELCNIALDGAKPKKPTATRTDKTPAKKPAATVGDGRVREDALECLRSARGVWSRGESVPSPELVWDQIWSILEEGGVLKKK
ncbi:MAG TPA: ribonuclease HI family protein [Gemmataceae bacterium]|jgi:ribonuclease HI|nr:ribonuclease HI family protein [Gemmataceae bacterium]